MTNLLLLGVGNCAQAVAAAAIIRRLRTDEGYDTIYGTTRSPEKFDFLRLSSIEPILLCQPLNKHSLEKIGELSEGAHVLVSFPPDPNDEEQIAHACRKANKIVYISSTGVYGSATGDIDESTPVDKDDSNALARLQAERIWQSENAIVLRAPGLYNSQYGLHLSLLHGTYRMPGDGNRFSSRIHLDDFATIILQAFSHARANSVYVVGDKKPTTQREVVTWLCERLNLPMPPSVPLDQVHHTLQANRKINSTKVLNELNVELKYPTYVEGFDFLSVSTEQHHH